VFNGVVAFRNSCLDDSMPFHHQLLNISFDPVKRVSQVFIGHGSTFFFISRNSETTCVFFGRYFAPNSLRCGSIGKPPTPAVTVIRNPGILQDPIRLSAVNDDFRASSDYGDVFVGVYNYRSK
jgi:hypothetical protein